MILSVPAMPLGLFFMFWTLQAMPVERETSESLPLICESGCQSGHECNTTSGLCEPIECGDCSHAPNDPVCGLDSITYINTCELKKSNCLNNKFIEIKHNGSCRRCNDLRREMMAINSHTTREQRLDLRGLCRANKATMYNLTSLYYIPECSDDNDPDAVFAPKQGNTLCREYWCVTADGDPITNPTHSTLDCSGRKQCDNNGVSYNDGDILKNDCGFNICLDGEIVNVSDYCPDKDGDLSEEQLMSLKHNILYLFHYQYNVGDLKHPIDLIFIRNNIPVMTTSLIETVLLEKFNEVYDLNGDLVLHESELMNFFQEIYNLILTKSFRYAITNVLDMDASGFVSLDEWNAFFSFDQGSSSGSYPVASGIASTQTK